MSKFWQLSKFWHRSLGDLNDVLIDPMEDWSLSRWSRDNFRSRELTFDGFPRLNFEIAASGRPRIQIQKVFSAQNPKNVFLSKSQLSKVWPHNSACFFTLISNFTTKILSYMIKIWFLSKTQKKKRDLRSRALVQMNKKMFFILHTMR